MNSIALTLAAVLVVSSALNPALAVEEDKSVLNIANFNSPEERNDYDGGYFGVWSKDPDDSTQGCEMFLFEPGQGGSGACLKLEYDVDSPNVAYNGFWLLFVDLDLSSYNMACFWIKGDKEAGYTEKLKIELKNEARSGGKIIEGITDEWKLYSIPFSDFGSVKDWKKMTEFVIVFEDKIVTKKQGVVYIDNIYFKKSEIKNENRPIEPPVLSSKSQKSDLKIADFDSKLEENDYDGGKFGAWNKDPGDDTQDCLMSFNEQTKHGKKGFSAMLEYDVDSPNLAYNGFWMKFNNLDLTSYENICFWVKGDSEKGYTKKFTVELKSEKEKGKKIVSGVTDQWQLIKIPLSSFRGLHDLTKIAEFVVIFDDKIVTVKEGVIYLDDIYFERKKQGKGQNKVRFLLDTGGQK